MTSQTQTQIKKTRLIRCQNFRNNRPCARGERWMLLINHTNIQHCVLVTLKITPQMQVARIFCRKCHAASLAFNQRRAATVSDPVTDAKLLASASEAAIVQRFLNVEITCSRPRATMPIHNLVSTLKRHHHARLECRFLSPRCTQREQWSQTKIATAQRNRSPSMQ